MEVEPLKDVFGVGVLWLIISQQTNQLVIQLPDNHPVKRQKNS